MNYDNKVIYDPTCVSHFDFVDLSQNTVLGLEATILSYTVCYLPVCDASVTKRLKLGSCVFTSSEMSKLLAWQI